MPVKVRIAPSPTGNLHIGTARTALFNWLFARRNGGQFILRIEDTDLERSKPEFEADIIAGLRWLGLDWDNGEPYRQSERLAHYRERLKHLMDAGKAVWREYSAEEKAAMEKEGRPARDRIIVLKDDSDPEREIAFDDAIRGRVSVARKHVGSLALAKDEDTPLYNFAVVVDDIEMGITHVIRGEDHISNTPKQLLIYDALGAIPPIFAHLPLILGTDRSKMSKRHGATSVTEYRADYLPDALVNFMGHLGHTYGQDILSRDELVQGFALEHVHKAGAVFDLQKLDWTNAQHIRRLAPAAFKEMIGKPELPDAAVPLMTERLERLSHAGDFSYFWEAPSCDAELLRWKNDDAATAARALALALVLLDGGALNGANLDQAAAEHFGGSKGSVYWPLRVALSGRAKSAGPLDILAVIGADEATRRVQAAITLLDTR